MPPLVLSDDEVQQLQVLTSSRSLPHTIVQRAQIVLACGAGESSTSIDKHMGLTGMTVGKWRKRYRELGLEGLPDELLYDRPCTSEADTVAEVINRARQSRLPMGAPPGPPALWLQTFSVLLHRQKHFQLSTDLFVVEIVRDIVGLNLNRPDKAMVLCVDETTQIQALDRTEPLLPM